MSRAFADESMELAKMSDRELVAYRNICLMSLRMQGDRLQSERHLPILESILRSRRIGFESGKLLRREII